MRTIDRGEYYTSFIKYHSSFSWVIPFNSKLKVPQITVNFMKAVRHLCNANMKRFDSNRVTENMNDTVQNFLNNHHGIRHETPAPMTPMQNRISDVYNRIIETAIRALLVNSDLPNVYGQKH